MNQHQRKFLLDTIEKQFRDELAQLRNKKPVEPSLNNYLTAAILDGSFVMRSQAEIRDSISTRVRDLGKGEALLTWSGRYGREHDGAESVISLPAELLFKLPPGYAKAKAEYDAKMADWNSEIKALENSIAAMRIKVQIGSDDALMALVNQADRLCSMSLTISSKLLGS